MYHVLYQFKKILYSNLTRDETGNCIRSPSKLMWIMLKLRHNFVRLMDFFRLNLFVILWWIINYKI